jgi:hypothetical protein
MDLPKSAPIRSRRSIAAEPVRARR